MKIMIRSFASALVAVMTLGLVQTAQAEPCSIEQLVEPEGVCTITQDKTQAEGGEEVKFTISNIKEGYQVEDVKVFLYGEGGEIYPDYNYEEDYYSFNMPEENVYIYVLCVKPTTEYSITYNASPEVGGKVEGGPSSATAGTVIGFTVAATNEAYAIDSVTAVWGSGTVDVKGGEGGNYWFDMPEGAVTVSATFVKAITGASISGCPESAVVGDTFQLAVNVEPSGEGVESYTTQWSSSDSAVATIDENGKVSVVGPGKVEFYAFVTGQRSGAELAAGVTCTAEAKKYSITIPKFDHGMVTSNVASTNEGATVTLTVTPDAGYELDTIKVDGIDPEKGEGSTYTFEMPASDVEVQATFKAAATKHTISTVADPEGTCLFTVYPSEMEAPAGTIVEFRFDLADGANFVSLDVYNTDNPSQSVGYEEFWWNGQQWYRFTMPDYNVTIKVKTESGGTPDPGSVHTISTVADPEGTCEFEVYPETYEAPAGDWVDFRFNLADGANLVSLDVYNTDDPSQTIGYIGTYVDENGVEWHYFEMPNYNVTIKVTTESGGTPSATAHDISTVADPADTCEFTLSKTWAWPNDAVDFRFNLADGANFVSLTVYNTADPTQTISEEDIGTYEDENGVTWYYFTMPDYDVTIKVTTQGGEAPATAHKISTSVTPSEACEVHAQESAQSGEEVYFEVGNFAAGATLGSLTVWNMSAGEQVKVEQAGKGYIFTMPDGDVLIEVVCSDPAPTKYKISTSVEPEGACEFGQLPESAQSGTDVYFELNFAAGAELVDLTVSNTSAGEKVKCEPYEKGYIFTMPAGEVLIAVSCSDPEPPTLVEVMPLARSYTSEIGAYTNGVLLTATSESTYIVNSNATVDVVFEANTSKGRYFKVNGVYTSIVTNTITASTDPYPFLGPIPDTGKKVGDSAYAFVDGATCTIVGSGTADTRLATVVSPGAITSVVIQPGITEIGARFFKDFKWLNAVTGGQDLKTVGEKAFYKCFSLETIDLDCTAVPTGLDGAVVYQNALKPDGTIYQIPNIKVKNHVATLYGKENLDDDWECLGPAEGAIIYDQGIYRFFQTRLVPEE